MMRANSASRNASHPATAGARTGMSCACAGRARLRHAPLAQRAKECAHDAAWQREGFRDCRVDVARPRATVRCACLVEEAPDRSGVRCSARDESRFPRVPLVRVRARICGRGRRRRRRPGLGPGVGQRGGPGGSGGWLRNGRRWRGRSDSGSARGSAADHGDDGGTRLSLQDWDLNGSARGRAGGRAGTPASSLGVSSRRTASETPRRRVARRPRPRVRERSVNRPGTLRPRPAGWAR
jgi:hypothetical protein